MKFSSKFLLKREPNTSIFSSFDITVFQKHSEEYEVEISVGVVVYDCPNGNKSSLQFCHGIALKLKRACDDLLAERHDH